jgi:hypothetical protein
MISALGGSEYGQVLLQVGVDRTRAVFSEALLFIIQVESKVKYRPNRDSRGDDRVLQK